MRRKRIFKRKRRYLRRRKVSRRYRRRNRRNTNSHSYKRYAGPSTIGVNNTNTDFSDVFFFENIQGYTDFTGLYDQYKISCVVVKFQLVSNPDTIYPPGGDPSTNITNPTFYPKLWYCRDYDDSGTNTVAFLRERSGAKFFILRPNKIYSVKVKLAVNMNVYRSGAPATAVSWSLKRLDMSNTNVPHYGLKWSVDLDGVSLITNSQFKLRVDYLYYFKCFNVR